MDFLIFDIFVLIIAFGLIVKSYFTGFYNGIIDCIFFIATFYIAVYIYPYSIEHLTGVTDNINILNIDKKTIFNATTISTTLIASGIISKTLDFIIKYIVNFPPIFPFVNNILGVFIGIIKTILFLNFVYIISAHITDETPPSFLKNTYSYDVIKKTNPTFQSLMPEYFNKNNNFIPSENNISDLTENFSSTVDDLMSDKDPLDTISNTIADTKNNILSSNPVSSISNAMSTGNLFDKLTNNYNNKADKLKNNKNILEKIAKEKGIDDDVKDIFINSNYKKPYIPTHTDNLDKFHIEKLLNKNPNELSKNELTRYYPKSTSNIGEDKLTELFNRDIENLSSKNIVKRVPENIQTQYLSNFSDLTDDEIDILSPSEKINIFDKLKLNFNRNVKPSNDIEDLSKILNADGEIEKEVHDALIRPHDLKKSIPLYPKKAPIENSEEIIISEPNKIISIEDEYND